MVRLQMAFNRWFCRPRILVLVAVLSLAYYVLFMGGVPSQWKERRGEKVEAIDESLKAVLNETLGVSLIRFFCSLFFLHCGCWCTRPGPQIAYTSRSR
jgi:hypothetical protein